MSKFQDIREIMAEPLTAEEIDRLWSQPPIPSGEFTDLLSAGQDARLSTTPEMSATQRKEKADYAD